MSYQFKIDPKRRASARFIASVRAELAKAIAEARARGLSQQALADRLGVNKSVITRLLTGEGNLTLRSLAEVAWGLDKIASIHLRDPKEVRDLGNIATATVGHALVGTAPVAISESGSQQHKFFAEAAL